MLYLVLPILTGEEAFFTVTPAPLLLSEVDTDILLLRVFTRAPFFAEDPLACSCAFSAEAAPEENCVTKGPAWITCWLEFRHWALARFGAYDRTKFATVKSVINR